MPTGIQSPQTEGARLDRAITDAMQTQKDWMAGGEALASEFARVIEVPERQVFAPFIIPTIDSEETVEGDMPTFTELTFTDVVFTLRAYKSGARVNQVDAASPSLKSSIIRETTGLANKIGYRVANRFYQALLEGDTNPEFDAWDGQFLFDTAHVPNPSNGQTWSNLFTGLPPTPQNLSIVMNNFMEIPYGPDGEFLQVDGARFYVLTNPYNTIAWKEILFNSQKAESTIVTENVMRQEAELRIDPRLTDKTDWWMFMVLPGQMPFLHYMNSVQQRVLRSDVAPGGMADLQGVYQWWMRSYELYAPTQFYQMAKVSNAS